MSFNGDRLRILRKLKGLTQGELGDLVAVSPAAISQYEHGRREPDDEIIDALCDELGVVRSYFDAGELSELPDDVSNFRSQRRTPARDRDRIRAYGSLLSEWVAYLRTQVTFPAFDVPHLVARSWEDIEAAADHCRDHWGLGFGPIRHITRVLENAGVVVSVVDDESTQIDAFSAFTTHLNMVVLNTAKGSSSRAVFDCMHEIGHAVLHRGRMTDGDHDLREAEANWFAGAFLLPRQSFPRELWSTGSSSLGRLVELKMRWGVSIQAMVYRARQLDLITTSQYRRLMKEISARGWRSGLPEPEEPEHPQPELLATAYDRFSKKTGVGPEQAARHLGWGIGLFTRITGIEGGKSEPQMHSLAEYRSRRA